MGVLPPPVVPAVEVHEPVRALLFGNIVIGIIGALLASWLLPQLGVSLGGSAFRDIINATIGGVIILVILSLIKRA